jgi:hypothetical protein
MGSAAAKQHRLPTAKFRWLHDHLRQLDLARPEQRHQPLPIPRRVLEPVHSRPYHHASPRDGIAAMSSGDGPPAHALPEQEQPHRVLWNACVVPRHDDRFGRLALRGTGKPLRDRMVLEACLRGIRAATVTGSDYDALTAVMRRGTMAWCSGRPRRRACR